MTEFGTNRDSSNPRISILASFRRFTTERMRIEQGRYEITKAHGYAEEIQCQ